MNRTALSFALVVVVVGVSGSAFAQTFEQRLEHLRNARKQQTVQAQSNDRVYESNISVKTRFNSIIRSVKLDGVDARTATKWWSQVTGISLVVNWDALEIYGVDPEAPVDFDLEYIPANRMLALMFQQIAPDVQLNFEVTPWYVQVQTREEANQKTIVRIYDINDLLMEIPNFTNAPDFDLQSALDNAGTGGGGGGSRSGGGGGGGNNGIFDTEDEDKEEVTMSKQERGEMIASLIRDTIEPEIWQFYGGEHASIRYLDGKLVINAPAYVHAQIGVPVRMPVATVSGGDGGAPSGRAYTTNKRRGVGGVSPLHRGVAGINTED